MLIIIFMFSCCGFLVKKTLHEIEVNPTITISEEVDISEIPAPTISILVPKGNQLNEKSYYIKFLNQFNACNPDIDMRQNSTLASFLPINANLNRLIRSKFGVTKLYQAMSVKELMNGAKKDSFCAFANKLQSVWQDSSLKEKYIKKVELLVDSDFLVNDYSRIIGKSISESERNTDCDGFIGNLTEIMSEWNLLMMPVEFKIKNNYGCSQM